MASGYWETISERSSGYRLRCPRLPQEQDVPEARDFRFPPAFLLCGKGLQIVQLLCCQRDGPDLPIAECVIAQVVVCHPNDLAHALGFGPQLWTAQQGSQSER